MFRAILGILFTISCLQTAHPQKVQFKHYTIEDGLQNNIVLSAGNDSKGLLWFGTITGLDRYDGNRFVEYKLPLKNGGYADYTQVPFIVNDIDSNLWVTTLTDIYKYNSKLDSFERLNILDTVKGMSRNITSFSSNGSNLFIGRSNGFSIYNCKKGRIFSSKKFNKYVRTIYQDKKGIIWVGTVKGLYKFIINENELHEFPENNSSFNISNETLITGISQDNKDRYWLVTADKGIVVYDELKQQSYTLSLPESVLKYAIKDIYHDKLSDLSYISFDGGGIIVVDGALVVKSISQTNEDDPSSLSNNAAYDIICDLYNRIWVTTYGGGVNELLNASQPFQNFFHEQNNINSLSNNAAKAVAEDQLGNIWFGTRKGLSKWIRNDNSWKHFNNDNQPDNFPSDNILILSSELKANGKVWTGTYGGGLISINPVNDEIVNYTHKDTDTTSLGSDFVYAVLPDSHGRIWCGGIRGPLSYLNLTTNKFQHIKLNVSNIYCIIENSRSEILVGTEKGIFIVDKFLHVSQLFPNSLNHRVLFIMEDKPGLYWIGTLGGGLLLVDHTKGITKIFKRTDGLPSDVICGILKEKNGDIWISTSKGLVQYRVSSGLFTTFLKADGLAGSQFNFGAVCETRKGEMLFGSVNGFSMFNPKDIKSKTFKPVIVFTSLSINNKPVFAGAPNSPLNLQIDETDHLQLKFSENTFRLNFANTSPAVSGNHLYSWKLQGFDKDWSQPVSTPSASYSNLDNGKYTLYIKAFAKGQSETAVIRKLVITINPPWWRSIWAYCGYLLLIAAGTFMGYNYFTVRNTRKKYAERLKLNTSISHEIRTPLTLIKGPVTALVNSDKIGEEERANLDLARKNIEKLEGIISQFIDYQKTGMQKMQMQVIKADFISLVDDVTSSFIPLMKEKNIHFTYIKPSDKIELLFDKDKMEKVLNNLLSNALKYTPQQNDIEVEITKDKKDLILKVKDTGIGIPPEHQRYIFKGYYRADNTVNLKETGSGIGLNVAKEMVEMHKGMLDFKSEKGNGTVFILRLPLVNNTLLQYLVKQNDPFSHLNIPEISEEARKGHSNNRIVVAEDNDELRQYLKRELTDAGYKVTEAPNGEIAFNLIQKNGTDLLITDVMMPEMNGFQLCSALRKDINTCHIPVIMLTAISDKDYLLEGYKSGADDYVRKPFDLAYIITRIQNLLENRTRFRNKIMSVFEHEENVVNNEGDIAWLKKATEVILENLENPQFSVEKFSSLMAMSRPVLFRKFKAIAGDSPQQYINQVRLRKAVELLQQNTYNINEIAYMTGFEDPKYFSTAFKKHFGKSPSEYRKEL